MHSSLFKRSVLVVALTAAFSVYADPGDDSTPPPSIGQLSNPAGPSGKDGTTPVRKMLLSNMGHTVGFRGGMAQESYFLMQSMNKQRSTLDAMYRFATVIEPSGALPPVIVEAQDVAHITGNQIRTANKVYKIIRGEEFVSVPPTWRDYLFTGLTTDSSASYPGAESQPANSAEKVIWSDAVKAGWGEGIRQADAIAEANFHRLTRDYIGMMRYTVLLHRGMIGKTEVAEQVKSVTSSAKQLTIGETHKQLTKPAAFQQNPDRWSPIISR